MAFLFYFFYLYCTSMRFIRTGLLAFFVFISCFSVLAGGTDSIPLLKALQNAGTNNQKINASIKLAKYFLAVNVPRSYYYSRQAKSLSQADNNETGLGDAFCAEAEADFLLSDYENAGKHFTEALLHYDKEKDPIGTAEAYEGLGKVAYRQDDLSAALAHFSEALKIFEKHNYKDGLAGLYINLGLLYEDTGNQNQAIDFYKKGLKIAEDNQDIVSESSCYTNLGNVYTAQKKFDLAIQSLEKSLELKKQIGSKKGEGTSLNNLGATYYEMGNQERALEYFQAAYDLYLAINDKKSSFPACNNIGSIYYDTKNYEKALYYFDRAYALAEELNSLSKKIVSLENLTMLHRDMGNMSQAVDYSVLCWQLKDTLYNREQAEINAEMQTKFSSEKKQQENEILNLQVKSESFMKMIFIAIAALMLVIAFFIFRGLRQKQKINLALEEKNKIIEDQKLMVEKQKLIVEEQNKDIKDSIKYAERIQQAILPPDQLWYSLLPDSFVFYQPKDILSGDFYWIERKEDWVFFAAADCTGHGVPGALISIVNYNLLNKAVLEKDLISPAEILNYVNNQLTIALHQSYQESSVKDGMDISLCALNIKTQELKFAGANNPVYLIQKGNLTQLNANKFPVGSFVEEKVSTFTEYGVNLNKGDVLYLFSDGYADQFGGTEGKKFKYKQFKEVLLDIHQLEPSDQHKLLADKLEAWKGNLEQVDDVLVIGIKL